MTAWLHLKPSQGNKEMQHHRAKTLPYVLGGYKTRLVIAASIGLGLNALVGVANPLALKYLFDEGIIKRDFTMFVRLGLLFVALFSLWRLGTFLYRLYSQRLKNTILEGLTLQMLDSYFDIPYGEIIKRENGY